jgi:hypothetical protein
VCRRKLQIRCIDHLGYERAATRDSDGLGPVVRFIASSHTGPAGFRASQILGAREFVAAVINHVVTGECGHNHGPQFVDFYLHENCGEDQEGLHDVGGDHDAKRNETERSFSCEASLGAG